MKVAVSPQPFNLGLGQAQSLLQAPFPAFVVDRLRVGQKGVEPAQKAGRHSASRWVPIRDEPVLRMWNGLVIRSPRRRRESGRPSEAPLATRSAEVGADAPEGVHALALSAFRLGHWDAEPIPSSLRTRTEHHSGRSKAAGPRSERCSAPSIGLSRRARRAHLSTTTTTTWIKDAGQTVARLSSLSRRRELVASEGVGQAAPALVHPSDGRPGRRGR